MTVSANIGEKLVPALLGAGVMAGSYVTMGWWLNAGDRLMITLLLVFVAALILGPSARTLGWFLGGLVVTMITLLFIDGPGTIFPIVIAIGTGFLLFAVMAGWVVRSLADVLTRKLLPHRGR